MHSDLLIYFWLTQQIIAFPPSTMKISGVAPAFWHFSYRIIFLLYRCHPSSEAHAVPCLSCNLYPSMPHAPDPSYRSDMNPLTCYFLGLLITLSPRRKLCAGLSFFYLTHQAQRAARGNGTNEGWAQDLVENRLTSERSAWNSILKSFKDFIFYLFVWDRVSCRSSLPKFPR